MTSLAAYVFVPFHAIKDSVLCQRELGTFGESIWLRTLTLR